jgi:hypothetical protein
MASVSIDPEIKLRLTPDMKELAQQVFNNEQQPIKDLFTVKEIKELKNAMGKKAGIQQKLHFHELVSKCELILPQPQFAPRNPELEARIKKLKIQQDQREYNRMTDNVDPWRQATIVQREDEPVAKQCNFYIKNFWIL